jgi:hypothetical protein
MKAKQAAHGSTMAPPKETWTAKAAKAFHNSFLPDLTRSRPGRPNKQAGNLASDNIEVLTKRGGPVPQPKKPPSKPTTGVEKKRAPEDAPKGNDSKVKKRRTNWGEADAKVKLNTAIKEWDGKTGRCAPDRSGGPLSLKEFSTLAGIPYDTFKKYVAQDCSKRRVLGNSVGRKAKRGQDLLADDASALKDRANEGANTADAIDLVLELNPSLSRDQARGNLTRTLIPSHPAQLIPRPVVAQATTTMRSGITHGQQFRWHTTYEDAMNELRRRDTGFRELSAEMEAEKIRLQIAEVRAKRGKIESDQVQIDLRSEMEAEKLRLEIAGLRAQRRKIETEGAFV